MPADINQQREPAGSETTALPLASLLRGKRYAWIKHGSETYLLQLTKSNKLLLTK